MIRLLQSYWASGRQAEICEALRVNGSNRYIDQLVVLAECPIDLPGAKIIGIDHRPTFADYFRISNRLTGPDDINIIANSDITFDTTVQLANKLQSGHCYAITRQDILEHCDHVTDSQDAWVFRGRILPVIADFELGRLRCDNRLLYELGAAGYSLSNPGLSIKLGHLHGNRADDYGEPVQGPIAWITPGYIES